MGQITKNDIISWVNRLLISVSYLVGGMFTAYNLTAFKTDKVAFYYPDDSQFWLAFGVSFLILGWLIRNGKRL